MPQSMEEYLITKYVLSTKIGFEYKEMIFYANYEEKISYLFCYTYFQALGPFLNYAILERM